MAHPPYLHTSVHTLLFQKQVLSFRSFKKHDHDPGIGCSSLVGWYDAQKIKPYNPQVGSCLLTGLGSCTRTSVCRSWRLRCARLGFEAGSRDAVSVLGSWFLALHVPSAYRSH